MNNHSRDSVAEREARRSLFLVTAAIMLQVFLSALDTTIISTAMPTVVVALGGLNLYGWVFSAYMLTSTVSTPISGKLSDQLSRKKIYLIGIAGFVISSWLCGLSQNMTMLIVFRAIQGLAAGAMIAVSMGLIAVLYPPEKRGRMQGMLASIWAITSMFGPLVGGFVVEHFSWRWSFYLNLPIGVTAWFFVKRYLHENTGAIGQTFRKVQIDYVGAIMLIVGVVAFLLSITNDSHTPSQWRAGLFLISILFLIAFFKIEQRAVDPILPLNLLKRTEIAAANLSTFVTAVGTFGMIMFAPLFVQGALLGSPSRAGMVLIPFSIGWALGSLASGQLVNRFGYRSLALAGTIMLTIGLLLQTQLDTTVSIFHIAGVCFIVGFGMGLTTTAITVSVQNNVDPSQVGVATSATVFSRILGAALGVSAMGAILSQRLETLLHGVFPGMANGGLTEVRQLLQPAARRQLSPESLRALRQALQTGLHDAFLFAAGAALVAIFIASRVSAQRPLAADKTKAAKPETQLA
jgi:EmrB/QacA subfamily drug resistance transporter